MLDAGAYGQANSGVASVNSGSIYFNTAALAHFTKNNIGINYYQHAKVEGFRTIGIWGNYNLKNIAFGASIDNFGDKLYHETRLGLAAAIKRDKVAVGFKFSYLNTAIQAYSSKQTILGEAGILIKPIQKLNIGLNLINFMSSKLYNRQNLPSILALGFDYKIGQKVNLTTQYDYLISEKGFLRVGMKYQIREQLALLTGIDPRLKATHFGLSFQSKSYATHFGGAISQIAGANYQLSILKSFGK